MVEEATKWLQEKPSDAERLYNDVAAIFPAGTMTSRLLTAADDKYSSIIASPHTYKLNYIPFMAITKEIYKAFLASKIAQSPIPDNTESPCPDEESAIYYIGGAFLRKLMKTKNTELGDFLNTWKLDSDETLTDFAAIEWTMLQGRGRLLYVSTSFYDILRTMETIA